MKIALLGYGKMGRIIDRLAPEEGGEVVLRIDRDNQEDLAQLHLADVAIEFSQPESAVDNFRRCFDAGVPVVSGTTGWTDRMGEVQAYCEKTGGAFFYASNFSIGVNVFFALNRFLADRMNHLPAYDIQLEETHHTQKLDAPSGTAITLAKDILSRVERKETWVNREASGKEELSILSHRVDPAPGTHRVVYRSGIDQIEIRHEAFSREGFARGALQAARWLQGRKGCFGMNDLLGF
ncbi:MAG: 4-hydroxy-tetrahydrodipicolinate reductase [Saprospirales bacterium]|nr:4-hydroxy-tetrahydrodipicolinate reductase [Saprospirales bacterium]